MVPRLRQGQVLLQRWHSEAPRDGQWHRWAPCSASLLALQRQVPEETN